MRATVNFERETSWASSAITGDRRALHGSMKTALELARLDVERVVCMHVICTSIDDVHKMTHELTLFTAANGHTIQSRFVGKRWEAQDDLT